MNATEVLGRLRGGDVPALTVLYGEESWFARKAVEIVRERFLKGTDDPIEIVDGPRSASDSEGVALARALEEACTVPMFASRRVVFYRAHSPDKKEPELLMRFAGSESTFVRMVYSARSLGKAAENGLVKAGALVGNARKLFDRPYPGQPAFNTALNKWLAERAHERGRRLDLRTAHVLTEQVGNDLMALESHLERILIAAGGKDVLYEDDVRDAFGGGREYDGFAFGEAVYERDAATAFRVCRNAFSEGLTDRQGRRSNAEGSVAARLLWSVRFRLGDVYGARALMDRGATPEEAAKGLTTGSPISRKRAVGLAAAFDRKTLLAHFGLLEQAEADLHQSVPAATVIETLIPWLIGVRDA